MNIFIVKNGEKAGPYTEGQILEMVSSGEIPPSNLGWHTGLSEWVALNRIPSLADHLNASPIPPEPEQASHEPVAKIPTVGNKMTGKRLANWSLFFGLISPIGLNFCRAGNPFVLLCNNIGSQRFT